MLDRLVPPSFSKEFAFVLPEPEIIGAAGRSFVFLSGVQQEVFKIEALFKAGKWYEPKLGLSHFTSILFDKGTSKKNSKEIAETLDYYGSQLEISSGYDFSSVSLYGLKKHIEKVVPLFIEMLSDAVFPQDELDLQKQIFLQNLEINEKKNSFLASKMIRRNIFGAQHPYGASTEKENVAAISDGDLKKYFRSHFLPYEIYGVGNLTSYQIRWCVDQFASLESREIKDEQSFPSVSGDLREHLVKSDSVQSTIRFGKKVINRGHADYFPLLLLNHCLGGYFGSRLMKNVREKKGLTYGIYSSLTPFRNSCLFSIGADVNKSNLELTVDEVKKELQALIDEPIATDELDIAKNHFLGSLQLEVANPFSTMDKIKSVRLNELGDTYYKRLIAEIKSATPGQLQFIAGKYFGLKDMAEVYVG